MNWSLWEGTWRNAHGLKTVGIKQQLVKLSPFQNWKLFSLVRQSQMADWSKKASKAPIFLNTLPPTPCTPWTKYNLQYRGRALFKKHILCGNCYHQDIKTKLSVSIEKLLLEQEGTWSSKSLFMVVVLFGQNITSDRTDIEPHNYNHWR